MRIFLAQEQQKNVAENLAKAVDGDLYEILSKDPYTSNDLNWMNKKSRSSLEMNNPSERPEIATKVNNMEEYDTILIGYPIWWGIAAWPVNTFVEANNFDGKTVIPFCTSSSSGLGQSGELLSEMAGSGNWLDGQRFSSNPSDSTINEWTDSLK